MPALRDAISPAGALAIPHHIGYKAGYRGIDWRHYREELSPFVEIFSLHGCSLSEEAPYPMLHTMGPRDFDSTAEAGWSLGYRFGIVGGTDHHGAYPGSHGDGRMGVFAESLTRESLWEAFLARRVFAATGDCIDARLAVDDAWIGSSIDAPNSRRLRLSVLGIDALEKVEVLKNGRVIRRFFPETEAATTASGPFRLRVTWGWGRTEQLVEWSGKLTLSDGTLTTVDSCFSGQAVVAPKGETADTAEPDDQDLPHAVLEQDGRSCTWRSMTTGNLTMRHDTTQALSLEIDAPTSASVTVEVNGQKVRARVGRPVVGRSQPLS